jgi:hypothetical protein
MAFTAQELANITNAALDFHLDRGKVHSQTIQSKPLLRKLLSRKKTFAGGKENLTYRVKGDYTTGIQGFTHDDTVNYDNPANIKEVQYPWKEIHWGISFTGTELKKDGISVVDSIDGQATSEHSGREMTVLANLLEDKLEDMSEGSSRGLNVMFWKDGTQDSKEVPGVRSVITNDPTAAVVVGGIDQSANSWWQNRAYLSLSTTTPSDMAIIKFFKGELRQLRRYGGKPDLFLCGSDFLDALEAEVWTKGQFTQTGWKNSGAISIDQSDLETNGSVFEYDPTLDDLSLSDYCFMIDTSVIRPYVMEGEDMKRHYPARPEDKYVYYRAVTWTGGLVCRRRNSSGVYKLA